MLASVAAATMPARKAVRRLMIAAFAAAASRDGAQGNRNVLACPPCQPVVDMMPVVGSYIAGMDANVLDRIDQRKDLANLWPASHREQDLRARIDLRQSGERLAETGGLGDRERGANGPVVVRSPPNQGKDLSRSIAFDTRPAVEDALCNGLAEPKPVFLHAAAPHQRDMREWRITGTCVDRFRRRKRSARCAFAQAWLC